MPIYIVIYIYMNDTSTECLIRNRFQAPRSNWVELRKGICKRCEQGWGHSRYRVMELQGLQQGKGIYQLKPERTREGTVSLELRENSLTWKRDLSCGMQPLSRHWGGGFRDRTLPWPLSPSAPLALIVVPCCPNPKSSHGAPMSGSCQKHRWEGMDEIFTKCHRYFWT